jgi:DNA anti-recombination protein RmuC
MAILSFIKAIPTMMTGVKFWIIAAVIASVVSGVVWFVYDYRETLQELAVAEQKVDDLEGELTSVNNRIQDEKKRTQDLRKVNSKISSQYLSKVRELQDLQQNFEMLRNEPDEAAMKIESSFNNFMNDISCITGESSQCPK